MTEQLRLRIAIFRDSDVSQEKCGFYLNEQWRKLALARFISLFLFSDQFSISVGVFKLSPVFLKEVKFPAFECHFGAIMIVALVLEVVAAGLDVLSTFVLVETKYGVNMTIVIRCCLRCKVH